MTRIIAPKIDFNRDVASRLLERQGLAASETNLALLTRYAKDSEGRTGYLNKDELARALPKMLKALDRPDVAPTQPLSSVLKSVPSSLSRYRFNLSDLDGDNRKDFLSIDPNPAKKQAPKHAGVRAMMAKSAKAKPEAEIGHTRWGGVTLTFPAGPDKTERLDFSKGKWITASFNQVLTGRPDLDAAKKKLKADGYNLSQQRDFLSFNLEGNPSPVLIALRGPGDHKAKIPADRRMPERPGMPPPGVLPSWYDKADYGFVSICNEVQVEHFGDQNIITIKKPVIYLYPDKKTTVRVHVEPSGVFAAQYPATTDGRWEMIATPDGTLFDPKTEKRYSYLFWEAESHRALEIDDRRAFCVKAEDAESFLEHVSTKYALTDRERTDFVSYWIPALVRNRYNMIQFLDEGECTAHARLTIEPKPDSTIRLFMIFRGADKPVRTGNPSLPEMQRGKFTAVEWGGANLDE